MKHQLLLAPLAMLVASPLLAATTGYVVTESTTSISVPGVGNVPVGDAVGEHGATGSTQINSSQPHGAPGTTGADGSLQIVGDRSRYVIGSIYENSSPGVPAPALITLKSISNLTFDYLIETPGTGTSNHQAPAGRIHVMDNGIRSEIIWELVYNGGTAQVTPPLDVWNTASSDGKLYMNVRDSDGAAFLAQNGNPAGLTIEGALGGSGVVYQNGGMLKGSLSSLFSYYSDNAYVTGFSVGAGSGATAAFVGNVDNLRLTTTSGDTLVVNFEPASAVPEPAAWAMLVTGFGLVGSAVRRRRVTVVRA